MRQKRRPGPPRGLPIRWSERWLTISGRLRDRRVLPEAGPLLTLVGRTVAAVGARLGSPSSAPIFGASPHKLVWGALNRFSLDPQIHWRRLCCYCSQYFWDSSASCGVGPTRLARSKRVSFPRSLIDLETLLPFGRTAGFWLLRFVRYGSPLNVQLGPPFEDGDNSARGP